MENSISIPLNLPDIRVVEQHLDNSGNIIITVKSTQNWCECQHCKRKTYNIYCNSNEKILRHTSILGKNTYIRIYPLRFECPLCAGKATTTQRLSWYEERSKYTIDYEKHVLLQLVNSTVSDVSIKENIGYDALEGIINRRVGNEVEWDGIDNLVIIGIDDLSRRKGRGDRIAVVSTRDAHGNVRIIALLKDHKKSTVKEFFRSIPNRLRKTVRYICTDLYDGFINGAREIFGKKVKIVADRFHVAKLYRKSVDELRKNELKKLENVLPEKEFKEVKKASLLIRKGELDDEEHAQLEKVFEHSPKLRMGWELMNSLTDIFNRPLDINQARLEIENWKRQVKRSGLSCFDSFVVTLKKYKCYILNYFDGRHSSGFVEGLNNKIRVLFRRCYGLLNLGHLFQRLTIDLEGYNRFLKYR